MIFLFFFVFYSIANQQAVATPIVSGDVALTPVPLSLASRAFENDDSIALVEEKIGFSLPGNLSIDVDGTPGTYDELADLTGGSLSAGTVVNSYILHFDPVGFASPAISRSGSVTFLQGSIIALFLTSRSLATSDILGATGTTYGGSSRGFELPAGSVVSDQVTISPDRRTVTVNFAATSQYDELRVLTNIPEPSSVVLASLLTVWCLTSRRRFFVTVH